VDPRVPPHGILEKVKILYELWMKRNGNPNVSYSSSTWNVLEKVKFLCELWISVMAIPKTCG